jgi:mono/diheme cytochrome c family protein
MRNSAGAVLFPMIVAVALAAGCSKPEAPKPPPPPVVTPSAEGKTIFEQKCGVCHGFDRATARKESKERWLEIVKSMQGKKADWISDAEAGKIVEFLATEHGKK